MTGSFPALINFFFLDRCQLPSFELFSAITRHCLARERILNLLGWHLLQTLSRRQLLSAPGLLCKPVSSKSFPTETSTKTRKTCSQQKLWDCTVVAGWFCLDTSTQTEKLHTCSHCKTLPLQAASWWWCSSHWAAGLCDTSPASLRGGRQAWGKEDGRADDAPLGGHTDQIGIPISSTGDRALTISAYHFQLLRDSRLRIRQRQNTAQERLRRWTSWFFVARCLFVRMHRREVIWSPAPRHSESRSISVASPVQENASSTGRCHEDVRNKYPIDEGSAPDNPDTVQSNQMLMLSCKVSFAMPCRCWRQHVRWTLRKKVENKGLDSRLRAHVGVLQAGPHMCEVQNLDRRGGNAALADVCHPTQSKHWGGLGERRTPQSWRESSNSSISAKLLTYSSLMARAELETYRKDKHRWREDVRYLR